MPSPLPVNSQVVDKKLSHYHYSTPLMARSIFCKKKDKKRMKLPPPNLPGVLTMYNIAR